MSINRYSISIITISLALVIHNYRQNLQYRTCLSSHTHINCLLAAQERFSFNLGVLFKTQLMYMPSKLN